MYGQTNCFVLPEGVYGAYKWADDTILIMSFRSAKGLAHQGYAKEWGKVRIIAITFLIISSLNIWKIMLCYGN